MNAPGLRRGRNGTRSINFLLPTEGTPVNGVAAQGTLTIAEPVTADDTITIGAITYTFKAGATYAKAQGTLTVDTQPLADDTFTIGSKTFTFVTDETANEDGEVDVGADLADAKVQIVAAINGTDGWNTAHTLVTAAAFATNDCVITAILPGTDGNSIATTETFDAVTNVFDAATLGTTTAGALLVDGQIGLGADEAATKVSIVAAINGTDLVNTAHALVSMAAFAGDDCVITALVKGVAGNTIVTTEVLTHVSNIFDAATLGTTTAGVDGTIGKEGEQQVDVDYLYICLDKNTIADANWKRIALSTF